MAQLEAAANDEYKVTSELEPRKSHDGQTRLQRAFMRVDYMDCKQTFNLMAKDKMGMVQTSMATITHPDHYSKIKVSRKVCANVFGAWTEMQRLIGVRSRIKSRINNARRHIDVLSNA